MQGTKTRRVIKELFIQDTLIGMCFWSLIILVVIPFFKLPESLTLVLSIFFATVGLLCLPFSLYKLNAALRLAKKGVEITATNISIEDGYFGKKVKFQYDYNGQRYHKEKYYPSIFFPEEDPIKLLVDPDAPSKFIILEFKKKSVISIVRQRNS